MNKSYKLTYKMGDEEVIEYFNVQKKEGGVYIGVSAEKNFYDETAFCFSTRLSVKELENLLNRGVAVEITSEEFVSGFNNLLKSVKDEWQDEAR